MAIHTKVGILTHVPGSSASVTPGLIDGLYADFLTKEFDFLDDSRMYPQNAWFTNDPWEYTNHQTGDWEDIGSTYRYWRNEYHRESNEYWLDRQYRRPFQYANFVMDPTGNGSNPLEVIRLVYPAPNGDFNIPYPNPKWSDGYSFHNPSYPLRHNMTRFTLPLSDMAWQAARSSDSENILENQSWIRNNQADVDAKTEEWYGVDPTTGLSGLLKPMVDFEEFILRSPEGFEMEHLWAISSYDSGTAMLDRTGAGGNYYRYANILIGFLKDLNNANTPAFYGLDSMLSVLSAVYGREFTQADAEAKLLALETFMAANNMTWRDESDVNYQTYTYWWAAGDGTSGWDVYREQYQSELQAIYQMTTGWIQSDTMSSRNTKYSANRDAFLKAMYELALGTDLSTMSWYNGQTQGITEEEFAAMRADFLNFDFLDNSPNPWSDEAYRFAWGDGVNPVEGAQNQTIHGTINGNWGQNTMTNHPLGTMPFEVLPNVDKINRLPAVESSALLPAVGNPGDVIRTYGDGNTDYAWDPQNQEWSTGFYARFLGLFDERMSGLRDAKLRSKNEMIMAMKPYLFAALHIPAFSLSDSEMIVK